MATGFDMVQDGEFLLHKAIWVNADATQEIKGVPGDYEVEAVDLLLKTICVAVNPGDYKHPEVFEAVNTIEGFDTVGEIVEIGSGVTGFEKGQKVVTFATGIGPAKYSASEQYFLAQASTSWTFGFKLPRFPGSISPLHTGNSFNSHRPSPTIKDANENPTKPSANTKFTNPLLAHSAIMRVTIIHEVRLHNI